MDFHPYANLFPMLDHERLQELADDIERNGQREPIRTYEGAILDGRNRWRACEIAGVQPVTEPFDGSREEALNAVVGWNLHRRHLSDSQRGMVGARLEPMFAELTRERQREAGERGRDSRWVQVKLPEPKEPEYTDAFGEEEDGYVDSYPVILSRDTASPLNASQRAMVASSVFDSVEPKPGKQARDYAAEAVNVSAKTVQDAKTIITKGTAELQALVDSGRSGVSSAAKAAKLPEEDQREVVRQIEEGEAKSVTEAIRKLPHVAHNSGNNEWYTPAEYIHAARSTMGSIDLDPASSEIANATVGATRFYTAETNGLTQSWTGNVWMNPPYEKGLIDEFAAKLRTEYEAGNVSSACVLVNNATDTRWFHTLGAVASAVCFPQGRVRFYKPDGEKGAPLQGQAVLYLGESPDAFREAFADVGLVFHARA